MSEEITKNPIVVSVINLKGGVGKTTVAALLARYAARMNLNVLAIDLDPQANLSQALMDESDYKQFMENGEPSIVELFNGYLPPSPEQSAPAPLGQIIRKVGYSGDNFHLIPSRFDFSDNPTHAIDVCGVLINNSRTSGSNRGPHHQDALSDIYDEANECAWLIMENQMFHSDGFPKLMSGDYNRLGHAPYESRTIANEFLEMMDLSPKEE